MSNFPVPYKSFSKKSIKKNKTKFKYNPNFVIHQFMMKEANLLIDQIDRKIDE